MGLHNPVSIRRNPERGKLWSSVQERGGLGDGPVPDYLHRGRLRSVLRVDARLGRPRGLAKKAIAPDVLLRPHAADGLREVRCGGTRQVRRRIFSLAGWKARIQERR